MMPELTSLLLASAVILAACAAAPATFASDGSGAPLRDSVPTLSVRGQAELLRPADQLEVTIGVVTEHEQAERAMRDNSRAMEKVVNALSDAGLTDREYRTGRFQLTPRYSPRPVRAEPDWQPRIIGYQVTNTVHVRTTKLELAGQILQKANEAGANTIDNIRFTLADPRVYRNEAIAEAAGNAGADARALAEAAGVRIVRVIALSLDDDQPIRPMTYERTMMMEAAADVAPPIEPGDVTVRAAVNIVYEIAPNS